MTTATKTAQLHSAIQEGRTEEAIQLMEEFSSVLSPSLQDSCGNSPLQTAIQYNNVLFFETFVQDIPSIDYLPDPENACWTIFHCAFNSKNHAFTELLLEYVIYPYWESPDERFKAVDYNALPLIKHFVENGSGCTDATEIDINPADDINRVHLGRNASLFHYACQHGSPEIIRYLLKHGADIWPTTLFFCPRMGGWEWQSFPPNAAGDRILSDGFCRVPPPELSPVVCPFDNPEDTATCEFWCIDDPEPLGAPTPCEFWEIVAAFPFNQNSINEDYFTSVDPLDFAEKNNSAAIIKDQINLIRAVTRGESNTVNQILQRDPKLATLQYSGVPLLHFLLEISFSLARHTGVKKQSAETAYPDILQSLIEGIHAVDPDYLSCRDNLGLTPLHYLALCLHQVPMNVPLDDNNPDHFIIWGDNGNLCHRTADGRCAVCYHRMEKDFQAKAADILEQYKDMLKIDTDSPWRPQDFAHIDRAEQASRYGPYEKFVNTYLSLGLKPDFLVPVYCDGRIKNFFNFYLESGSPRDNIQQLLIEKLKDKSNTSLL